MGEPEGLIPKHGGYQRLKSFQVAQLAYDVTVRFCDRYIDKRSRTRAKPKHEIRISKPETNSKPKNEEKGRCRSLGPFRICGLGHSGLFRISRFGFRISLSHGALALIAVASRLLDRQLAAQARAFEQQGGFAERLYRFRRKGRGQE